MRKVSEKKKRKRKFFFCYFSFHHRYNMHKFHIFNVFFYFDAYVLKKKRKSVIYEWSLLCASPFSQVTRLKVKKSDKFYIPSTFCDYLKRRKKNIRFTFFFYSQRKKRREERRRKRNIEKFSFLHESLERTISVPC